MDCGRIDVISVIGAWNNLKRMYPIAVVALVRFRKFTP
jgi:hypothetical protein